MKEWEELVTKFLNGYVEAWHKEHHEPCVKRCKERVKLLLTTVIFPGGTSSWVTFRWTSDEELEHELGSGVSVKEAIENAHRTIDAAKQRNDSGS